MDHQASFDALRQLYADFLENYAQADPPGWLSRFLQGGPSKAERNTILDFYGSVEAAVQAMRADMTSADSALAAEVVRFLIIEAEGNDPSTQLTVTATQALAIPLLDLLSPADTAVLLADYKVRYPKKRMLTPKQEELLKALKSHT